MCPEKKGHGDIPEFSRISSTISAASELDRDLRHEHVLGSMARSTDVQRNRVGEIYWPMAEKKGIHQGDTFVVKGKSLQVKALIMKGQHCFVVLNDESGFNRTEINLKNSFWDEVGTKEVS